MSTGNPILDMLIASFLYSNREKIYEGSKSLTDRLIRRNTQTLTFEDMLGIVQPFVIRMPKDYDPVDADWETIYYDKKTDQQKTQRFKNTNGTGRSIDAYGCTVFERYYDKDVNPNFDRPCDMRTSITTVIFTMGGKDGTPLHNVHYNIRNGNIKVFNEAGELLADGVTGGIPPYFKLLK